MTIEIPLTQGLVALVDDADGAIAVYRWHAHNPGGNTFYAIRNANVDGRWTTQRMHSAITGWPQTDHINGNGLDNRRSNLRPATRSQNMHNVRARGGVSRFKGVSRPSGSGRWRARIKVDYQEIYLGRFDTEIEAALAYDTAARQLCGEYAALNYPRHGEQSAFRQVVERWQ